MLVMIVAYFLYILILPQYNADLVIENLNVSSCALQGHNLTCCLVNTTADPIIEYVNNITQKVDNLTIFTTGIVRLNLDVFISINASSIYLENHSKNGPLVLNASATNNATRKFVFQKGAFFLSQSDNFFEYFPRIQAILSSNSYLQFGFQPSFVSLMSLGRLQLNIFDPNDSYSTFTAKVVKGLTNLTSLTWSGNLKGIEPDSFDGLLRLTYLDLRGNSLADLSSRLFKENHIQTLILDTNLFSNFTSDFFENLDQLKYISINNNPNFLVNSFVNANSLQRISLQSNLYDNLSPLAFQQLPNLTRIDLDGNPFHCDCELRWASIVSLYGIEIMGGKCLTPLSVHNIAINDVLPYLNCEDTKEYACFNKTIASCPGELLCLNSARKDHFCGCLDGYFNKSTTCYDINECNNTSRCQNTSTCINSPGSYKCGCSSGYELNSDGISCNDVNECVENNGGCAEWCRNNIGSYECCGIMNFNCMAGYLPFVIWGSVASGLFFLFLVLFFIILIIAISKSRSRSPKFENLEHHHSSPQSLTASYTKMEPVRIESSASTRCRPIIPTNKPKLPPNKPTLPRSDRKSSQESRRELPSIPQDDELMYEAFDVGTFN